MPLRKSKATKAREAVTEQVGDRTDDLMAALDAAKEALARAADTAGRKGAELGKEASKAADKLLPERAKQRRREAARRRNRRLLAGAAGLAALGVLASRLTGSRTDKADGGWDRAPEPGAGTEPAASAEVTQLHTNGAGGDPARTPPS
jgi:ferric-dicitrate binding protein FerR (iron transport regulator)